VEDRNSILRTNRRNIFFHFILRIGNKFMVEDISAVNFSFPLEMASLQQLIILLAARKYFGNKL